MTNFISLQTTHGLGEIILNRPQAYNALNHEMILALHHTLTRWAHDSTIQAVLIYSSSEKAFCAGGDIKEIYNNGTRALPFFQDEYRLNYLIYRYPKPYIALVNGITMGGGMGISTHANHRVTQSNTIFAMPETQIGFFPDIGSSYFNFFIHKINIFICH